VKLSNKEIKQTMCVFLLNSMFMYEYGDEENSWTYLFLREKYKDLLEKA